IVFQIIICGWKWLTTQNQLMLEVSKGFCDLSLIAGLSDGNSATHFVMVAEGTGRQRPESILSKGGTFTECLLCCLYRPVVPIEKGFVHIESLDFTARKKISNIHLPD